MRKRSFLCKICKPVLMSFVVIAFIAGTVANATKATPKDMEQVCQNWITHMTYQKGEWGGSVNPKILRFSEIIEDNIMLGHCYLIEPTGFVIVPILREMPPVMAYSEKSTLHISETDGPAQLIKDVLLDRAKTFINLYGSLDSPQPATGDVFLGREHGEQWNKFAVSPAEFEALLHRDGKQLTQVGPLLTSDWHQENPYWNSCPLGNGGGRCLVGCVATAASQIMNYWDWPPSGTGTNTYWWGGDGSASGQNLTAVFSDAYDWADMPDNCVAGCTAIQQNALAELCFEVGVAFEMNYGVAGSGASTGDAVNVYPAFFRYNPSIRRENRDLTNNTAAEWFDIIRRDINAGRPIQYRIFAHSIVCDGWRQTGGLNQFHMNYGWLGGANDIYYTVDNLLCNWDPQCGPAQEFAIVNIMPLNTQYHIILIDVTGSMSTGLESTPPPPSTATNRLERAAELAKEDIDDIFNNSPAGNPTPLVAVMRFATGVPGRTELVRTFTADRNEAKNAVDWIRTDGFQGATPLAEAMCSASDLLFDVAPANCRNLHVYTDGGENSSSMNTSSPVCGICGLSVSWNTVCIPTDCDPGPSITCTDFECCLAERLVDVGIFNARYFGPNPIRGSETAYSEDDRRSPDDDVIALDHGENNQYGDDPARVNLADFDFLKTLADLTGGYFSFMRDDPYPKVRIPKMHNVIQGHFITIPITIENGDLPMGGFDFLIAYDAPALTFIEAVPGQLLEDCGWEYFTYRYGVHGNCGNACPSGMLRVVAIADMNNGTAHPACFGPPEFVSNQYELAEMKFLVTNDRTFACQFAPIKFFWDDCGDNSISSVDGEVLYIDRAVCDFEDNIIWDEFDDVQFPEDARIPFVGAPDHCLNPNPEKPSAVRFIDFISGGIDIICAESLDTRGDVNLNGLSNEIGDAVVFTNYFIVGLAAFTVNVEGQIAASEVNCDGIPLSVADLVYLIRVIIGDALPCPPTGKLQVQTPIEAVLDRTPDGTLSVSGTTLIGAAYLVVEGEVTPALKAEGMKMAFRFDGTNTRILIYPPFENSEKSIRGFSGEFLEVKGNLVSAELATVEGVPVKLNLTPAKFALAQNFPNPFNLATQVEFSLPAPVQVKLEIYNVMGQLVRTLVDQQLPAGYHKVIWDGRNDVGTITATGIYFYKLRAGDFTETKKMLLLK